MLSARRCLVADDHPAVAATVSQALTGRGVAVVGPAADGRAALALAAAERPELAIVDLRMPRLEGVQLVEALVAASPSTAICVYTGDGDEELARACIDAGARAFVLKESSLDDLGRALDAVCASRTYLDPALVGNRKRTGSLTERELDVLRLLADGHAHEEIGRRLGIGAETVRTHVRKASDRLGAGTRTQAVATALRLGLIA